MFRVLNGLLGDAAGARLKRAYRRAADGVSLAATHAIIAAGTLQDRLQAAAGEAPPIGTLLRLQGATLLELVSRYSPFAALGARPPLAPIVTRAADGDAALLPFIVVLPAREASVDAAPPIEGGVGMNDILEGGVLPTAAVANAHDVLTAAGVHIGERPTRDARFREMLLPEGWHIDICLDDYCQFYVKDEQDRSRALILFMEYGSDRVVNVQPLCRFTARMAIEPRDKGADRDDFPLGERDYVAVVEDCGERVFSEVVGSLGANEYDDDNVLCLKAYELAEQWLRDNYPDFADPAAYWDR